MIRPAAMGRPLVGAAGAALLTLAVTGRGTLFVRPWFLPVVALAGVTLAAASWRGSGGVKTATGALLLLPLVVGLALPTSAVGDPTARSATGGSSVGARFGDPANPLLAGRGGAVTVLQVRAAEQDVGPVALAGQAITTTGFVSARGTLSRLVMVCCAADARAVTVPVTLQPLPVGHWVTVRGRLTVANGELVVQAMSVEKVPTPADPIL